MLNKDISDRLVRFSELTILLSVPNDTLTTISAIAQIINANAGYWSDTAAISKQADLALCFSPTPIQAQGFHLYKPAIHYRAYGLRKRLANFRTSPRSVLPSRSLSRKVLKIELPPGVPGFVAPIFSKPNTAELNVGKAA